MDELKVCFVGVGSIAKRHIRNLHAICDKKRITLTVDAYRREENTVEGIDNIYISDEEAPSDYDVIFITNPTELHLGTLKQFHNKGKHFFIEKPAVSLHQIEEGEKFQLRPDSVYYVACPLRYNAVIQWIRNNIDKRDILSVRSISSSYLPNWRPGKDYRNTYSAHKELGGGVSIDLIHEWDYLTYLFGWPNRVSAMIGKVSDLEIDSDDYAIYLAEYTDKIIELHLDYFGKKTIREIQLFTKEETVIGDIVNNRIRILSANKELVFSEERDDFQKRELDYFLDMISGRTQKEDSFNHALRVIELTQGRL